MSEAMYQEQDREVISMVNEHARRKNPVVGVIVPSCNVAAIEEALAEQQRSEAMNRKLERIAVAAGRGGLGLLCISAMVNGLMDPGLATVAALACVVWATAGYRRGRYGKTRCAHRRSGSHPRKNWNRPGGIRA